MVRAVFLGDRYGFVEQIFDAYLRRGVLAHGFLCLYPTPEAERTLASILEARGEQSGTRDTGARASDAGHTRQSL